MSSHGRTVYKLAALVVGMFGFGFALVPLYDVLCELTGLGGRTGGPYAYDAASATPDRSRLVKVNFITNTNAGMTWEFKAQTSAVRVHPGELKEVSFYVRNPTNRTIVGQAVPSLAPQAAAAYFHKTECFCFERQTLGPGESLSMPMRFIVGRELPENVQSISLSYALFDVTELARAAGTVASDSGQRI
jgi:cytochrome c oxidase assembly protein subunit 11